MPVKIELQALGAGSAVLRVGGNLDTPESVALAIQRNDGLYLGPAQVWQTSPHWHPQFGVQPRSGGLAMELGAEIVDGVIDAGGVPLKVSLRLDEREESGVLRIRGELIGSGAAAPVARPARPPAPDLPLRSDDNIPDLPLEPGPDAGTDVPPPLVAEPPEHRRRHPAKKRPRWLLFLLLVLLAAAAGGWYLGLFAPFIDGPAKNGQSSSPPPESPTISPEPDDKPLQVTPDATVQEPPVTAPSTGSDPAAPREETATSPPLTGLAYALEFLADHPTPNAIFAQGTKAEQAGDCDAAVVLFNSAADQDPAQATQLATRYDPEGFKPGPCIDQPDAPYAIIFYGDAAATGAVVAQRRLGQLLTAREASGPTFEEGIEWLRKAAGAGDAPARASLEQLEKRP
jgi:hypothetical protein